MTTLWTVILAVAVASAAIKAAGPMLFGGRQLPERVAAVVSMLAPAMLAGLVVTQILGGEGRLVLDERLLGVAVAAIAFVARAPVLVAVLLAAVTVAVARLVG
ncbi:MAG TPA: AzlD domain-containing protein [Thermomicrobiales bacterium]|nr:AzlD domain-containing protein [Thermomicrobiales bacterium]